MSVSHALHRASHLRIHMPSNHIIRVKVKVLTNNSSSLLLRKILPQHNKLPNSFWKHIVDSFRRLKKKNLDIICLFAVHYCDRTAPTSIKYLFLIVMLLKFKEEDKNQMESLCLCACVCARYCYCCSVAVAVQGKFSWPDVLFIMLLIIR